MKSFVAFAAILACAVAYAPAPAPYYGSYGYAAAPYYGYAAAPAYYSGYSSYAAPAPVTVLPSGFLADTPEVAHAKAAHLAEKAKVASKSAYAPTAYAPAAYPYAYSGAYAPYAGAYAHGPAQITVLPSGYLADTPEVAHAKAAHFVEKAKSAAAAAASPEYSSEYGYAYKAYAPYSYGHY